MHHWLVLTVTAEGAMTQEARKSLDDLHAQLLGRIEGAAAGATEELVPGIPRPAWFNPRSPTLSEVTGAGLGLRRTT